MVGTNIYYPPLGQYFANSIAVDSSKLEMGFGDTVADRIALFYVDNGAVSSDDQVWLQTSLDVLCGLTQPRLRP